MENDAQTQSPQNLNVDHTNEKLNVNRTIKILEYKVTKPNAVFNASIS